ncbi:MAG: DUF4097 domain-containing protein [Oscillospiraceae bacterium]|jgi:DUF4097 and DUF4098 domain-containing protein YvlB|nr:DUF4097 domain-containing protein [Oscillospiraceae bacterium]
MSKSFKTVLIVLTAIFLAIAVLVAAYMTNGIIRQKRSQSERGLTVTEKLEEGDDVVIGANQMLKEEKFSGDVRSLNIEFTATEIRLLPGDGEIVIRQYSDDKNFDPDRVFTAEFKNGVLKIEGDKSNRLFNFNFSSIFNRNYLEIYLPEAQYDKVKISSVSGAVKSEIDIAADDINIESTSGGINLQNLEGSKIKLESVSGGIKGENANSESVSINSGSGALNFDSVIGQSKLESISGGINIDEVSGNANIKASSGYVRIDSLSGSGRISSVSGSVDISRLEGDLYVDGISGSVRVAIPEGQNFKYDLESVSGSVDVQQASVHKSGRVSGSVGSDGYNVKISTVSGSVKISS